MFSDDLKKQGGKNILMFGWVKIVSTQKWKRKTLHTHPILRRARHIYWSVLSLGFRLFVLQTGFNAKRPDLDTFCLLHEPIQLSKKQRSYLNTFCLKCKPFNTAVVGFTYLVLKSCARQVDKNNHSLILPKQIFSFVTNKGIIISLKWVAPCKFNENCQCQQQFQPLCRGFDLDCCPSDVASLQFWSNTATGKLFCEEITFY